MHCSTAHARSGEPAVISGYLGKSDTFDRAIAAFFVAYANQTERNHAALEKAVRSERLEVVIEKQASILLKTKHRMML